VGESVPRPVQHFRSSVRETEGALHSLLAHALLTGKRPDLNLAKTARLLAEHHLAMRWRNTIWP
jgi:chromosomal replication initiation ATPase DnaA